MKRILQLGLVMVSVAGLIFSICSQPVAEAASAADFFKKNVVTIIVGYSPGGGSDYAARLLASYWPDATDGGAMIVKNMPGAGGLVATNYVNSVKPNGLTIGLGMVASTYLMPFLTKDPAAKYDAKKLQWLVGVFHEPWGMFISAKRPYESAEDLKKAKGLKCATVVPFGASTIAEAFFIDVLRLDAKIISGYKGGSAMALAGGKGEVDIVPNPMSVGLRGVEKGFLKPAVAVIGRKRVDVCPDSPTLPELVKFTPEQEAQFKRIVTASYILRVAAAAPGVPHDRVTFIRNAFAKIVGMKGFKRQSKLPFPLGPTAMIGEDLNAFMEFGLSMDIAPMKAQINKYLAIK